MREQSVVCGVCWMVLMFLIPAFGGIGMMVLGFSITIQLGYNVSYDAGNRADVNASHKQSFVGKQQSIFLNSLGENENNTSAPPAEVIPPELRSLLTNWNRCCVSVEVSSSSPLPNERLCHGCHQHKCSNDFDVDYSHTSKLSSGSSVSSSKHPSRPEYCCKDCRTLLQKPTQFNRSQIDWYPEGWACFVCRMERVLATKQKWKQRMVSGVFPIPRRLSGGSTTRTLHHGFSETLSEAICEYDVNHQIAQHIVRNLVEMFSLFPRESQDWEEEEEEIIHEHTKICQICEAELLGSRCACLIFKYENDEVLSKFTNSSVDACTGSEHWPTLFLTWTGSNSSQSPSICKDKERMLLKILKRWTAFMKAIRDAYLPQLKDV